jgi:catechol 2,3-dioxygenase-like lactoylglutathione lyase family enzyme
MGESAWQTGAAGALALRPFSTETRVEVGAMGESVGQTGAAGALALKLGLGLARWESVGQTGPAVGCPMALSCPRVVSYMLSGNLMLDHVSIAVTELARAAGFYDAVLATLGLVRTRDRPTTVGYGLNAELPPIFWIHSESGPNAARPGRGLHVSFRARDRTQVHAFHAAALAHGGRDAGAPGPRPQYTAGFYGAFALDLDGTKIEVNVREALPQESRS